MPNLFFPFYFGKRFGSRAQSLTQYFTNILCPPLGEETSYALNLELVTNIYLLGDQSYLKILCLIDVNFIHPDINRGGQSKI